MQSGCSGQPTNMLKRRARVKGFFVMVEFSIHHVMIGPRAPILWYSLVYGRFHKIMAFDLWKLLYSSIK